MRAMVRSVGGMLPEAVRVCCIYIYGMGPILKWNVEG